MSLFDIASKEIRLKELEEMTNQENFWNNQENSAKVLQELKQIKDKVNIYNDLSKRRLGSSYGTC